MILVLTEKSHQVDKFKPFVPMRSSEHGIKLGQYDGQEIILCPLSGHVFSQREEDLKLSGLNFIPPTEIMQRVPVYEYGKGKVHRALKFIQQNYLGDIDLVVLATDPDAEGCAIGHEVVAYYRFDQVDIVYMDTNNLSAKPLEKAFRRAVYERKDAVEWEKMAISSYLKSDFNITGLATTLAINKYFKSKGYKNVFYTIGTQQTRALNLLVERYKAHKGFDRSPHYRLIVHTKHGDLKAVLPDNVNDKDESEIRKLASRLGNNLMIASCKKTKVASKSPEWFDGSKLGAKANLIAKIGIKKMFAGKTSVMQMLYQKDGAITYIRSESGGVMPIDNLDEYRQIAKHLKKYYPAPRLNTDIVKPYLWKKADGKVTVAHTPCTIADMFDIEKYQKDTPERVVIDLAAKQILATFYPEKVTLKVSVTAKDEASGLTFVAEDRKTLDLGWGEIYKESPQHFSGSFEVLQEGFELPIDDITIESYTKKPPPLFTEESFVEELKRKKIGSESTYGSYLDIVKDKGRGYGETVKGKLVPTEKGIFLSEAVPKETQNILNLFEGVVIGKYLKDAISIDEALKVKAKISLTLFHDFLEIFKKNEAEAVKKSSGYQGSSTSSKKELVGAVCPMCKNTLIATEKVVSCSNRRYDKEKKKWVGCPFTIFLKNSKGLIYTLSEDEVVSMISSGSIKRKIYDEKRGFEREVVIKLKEDKSGSEVVYT